MYQKQFQEGPATITISEENGVAKIDASASVQAGGGEVAGFAKASFSAGIEVSAQTLIDAGFDLAAQKFPGAAVVIAAAKAEIDAIIAKA